jgi:hypothetical protein
MSRARTVWAGRILGAVLATFWVLPAMAQTEDPAALTIGPLEFRPRLVFRDIGIDRNVFNDLEDPKDDFTATISPDLEVTIRPGPFRFIVSSGTDYVYFRRYASERSVSQRFAATAEFDTPLVRPFVTYAASRVTGRPGPEIDERVRHRPKSITGGLRLVLASRTSALLSARRATVEYEPGRTFRGVELARTLDSRTMTYEGSLLLEATPLTTVGLLLARDETRFDFSPVRDSHSYRIAPTITISPLGLLTGTASVGYRRFDGRDPALPSFSGLYASGALSTLLVDRFRIQTTFARDVRYSYEETLPYYVQNAAAVSLATYLFGGADVRFHGGRDAMDYRAFVGAEMPGRDVVTTYGGGMGYRLADRMQLVLTAEKVHRTSEFDRTREYRNNRLFATVIWGTTTR